MRVAVPPVIAIVYKSPSSSKTMLRPSGETSSEIQVPSCVSNSTLRVGVSGRLSFFVVESAAAGGGRTRSGGTEGAQRGGASGMTAARNVATNNRRITDLRVGNDGVGERREY